MEPERTDASTSTTTLSAPEAKARTLKGPVIIVLAIVVFLALGVLLNPLPKRAELAILDRPATAADTLPDGVSQLQDEGYTVRLAAHEDGIRYFISGNPDRENLCVTVIPDNHPTRWSTGCGQGTKNDQEIVRTGSNGIFTAVLVPDGYDAAELERGGFKKVHGNIYAVSTERVPGSR
jgi:hypothetical protein